MTTTTAALLFAAFAAATGPDDVSQQVGTDAEAISGPAEIVDDVLDELTPPRPQTKKGGKSQSQQSGSEGDFSFLPTLGPTGVAPMGLNVGVGGQLGIPTAFNFKYMLTRGQGINVGAGFGAGFGAAPSLSLHVDYNWHPHILAQAPPFKLSWFIGGGAWMGVTTPPPLWFLIPPTLNPDPPAAFIYWRQPYIPIWLGGRIPIGLNLALNQIPLEFFMELAPAILVFPGLGLGVGGTLGARWYF